MKNYRYLEDNQPVMLFSIDGISMLPTFAIGDEIITRKFSTYAEGDVLVFKYEDNKILVHRLLKIKKGYYFCKGDNAFRIEIITYQDILGKVIFQNNKPLQIVSPLFCQMSFAVGYKFIELHYDMKEIKKTGIYRLFCSMQKNKPDLSLIFKLNSNGKVFISKENTVYFFHLKTRNTYKCLDLESTIARILFDKGGTMHGKDLYKHTVFHNKNMDDETFIKSIVNLVLQNVLCVF